MIKRSALAVAASALVVSGLVLGAGSASASGDDGSKAASSTSSSKLGGSKTARMGHTWE